MQQPSVDDGYLYISRAPIVVQPWQSKTRMGRSSGADLHMHIGK